MTENTNSKVNAVTSPQITIRLDSQSRQVALGTTLAQLLAQLDHSPDRVSTAVNGEFVARDQRAQRTLKDGDVVLLFQPIVGG